MLLARCGRPSSADDCIRDARGDKSGQRLATPRGTALWNSDNTKLHKPGAKSDVSDCILFSFVFFYFYVSEMTYFVSSDSLTQSLIC